MKLGILVNSFRLCGGGYQYTISLLEALHQRYADEVIIFINSEDNAQTFERFVNSRWKIESIDSQSILKNVVSIQPYLASNRLDVIRPGVNARARDFFLKHQIDLLLFSLTADLSFTFGIPYITPVHDLQHQLQPEFPEVSAQGEWHRREYIFRNAIRYAQGILVDSEVGKEDVLNFYGEYIPPERVYSLPFVPAYRLGQEVTKARIAAVRENYQLPERYLFYPAQFWLHKNHARLVHAIHQLRVVHGIDAPLILVGNENAQAGGLVFQNAMFLAEQLGVNDLVRHLGYVPDEDMPALYAMATALTMPTFFGPTNIPVLEAWGFGCPALSSDIRGIREQVGDAGILVDPTDTAALVDGILKLWKDENLRQSLVEKGHRRLASYTFDDFATRICGIIDEVWERVSSLRNQGGAAPTLTTNIASIDSPQFLASLSDYIGEYLREPSNQAVLAYLRHARQQIAHQWLNLSAEELAIAYEGNLGKEHLLLLNSGIKDEPLTDDEKELLSDLVTKSSGGVDDPKAIQYLLAAMLYCRPHQLPLRYDLTHIPNWLLNDYLKFTLSPPLYFQEIGEADSYHQYMEQWVNYLHSNIVSNPEFKLWQDVADYFTQAANFIPLYFNSANLKDIYTKRADIMEVSLKNRGHNIDYEFPECSPERKKIRIGILAAHFGPQTETFATLPIYKHLNRDLFEIILYTVNTSDHRLERYCAGHADALVILPADLPSQVQTIREAELDILFISNNVTTVTHQITLLALHRLARIQMVDANSPVTTGMRHVDYYISSKLSEPEEEAQQHYTETLVTLDNPPQCFDFATEEQILSTISISRESLGLGKTAVVYVSGANYYKIIPEVEAAWAKIIASVPNSILLLYPFNPNWSSSYPVNAFRKRIAATFAKQGLGEDRLLVLDPAANRADVKERLKLGDIYLDSYPYSGMTSLIDPLEIGLPTVAMEAESSRSKKGASLLRELQITELIASSEETYIQLAVTLGTNPELRQQKSNQIKQKMQSHPRFLDSRSHSAQMGTLFQEIFRKHQAIALTDNLKLRDINLIIFPDWSQPEEILYQELASAITNLVNDPDKNKMTLLIDTGNLTEDEGSLFLSEVVMNLLLEEDLDVADGPEISLVGQLSEMQWEALLPRIHARIVLENENQEAITHFKAENIPLRKLDSLLTSLR